jgi:LDH2 family malate/lactate/ureidoglycolate dehydrogenase
MNFTDESLRGFYYRVLLALGTGTEEASIAADALVDADLRGIDTHGALRIPAYVRIAREKSLDATAKPRVEWRKGALSLINGNNGWGHPAARLAVYEVITNAKNSCIGAAGVYNSNHIGTCAFYARMLARAGLVGFVTTNAPSAMAPTGAAEAVLGTNPICFGAPASGGRIVVVDMATSVVARGKIRLAAERGQTIPDSWATDKDGHPTTDPKAALGGYLLPVGGPKGYGLALFADIFSGVLTGSKSAKDLSTIYAQKLEKSGVGAFVFGIDTAAFGASNVNARMDNLIKMVVGAKRAKGIEKIYLPGEIEDCAAEKRKQEGIPVGASVLAKLNQVAVELGITPLPAE